MAVKIRLARIGKKNAPMYRFVAIDSRKKRNGEYIENLGTYDPERKQFVQYHLDKVQAWLNKGAVLTDTAARLHKVFIGKPAAKPAGDKKSAIA